MKKEFEEFTYLMDKIELIQGLLSNNNSELTPIINAQLNKFQLVLKHGSEMLKQIRMIEKYNEELSKRDN